MKTSYLLVVPLIGLMGFAACSGSESVSVDQPSLQPISHQEPIAPAPLPAETLPPEEQVVTGQVSEIDLNAKTFVLTDEKGNVHSFVFSEATRLTGGVKKPQDLGGHEGNYATIRYVESDNHKSAVHIQMELGS